MLALASEPHGTAKRSCHHGPDLLADGVLLHVDEELGERGSLPAGAQLADCPGSIACGRRERSEEPGTELGRELSHRSLDPLVNVEGIHRGQGRRVLFPGALVAEHHGAGSDLEVVGARRRSGLP